MDKTDPEERKKKDYDLLCKYNHRCRKVVKALKAYLDVDEQLENNERLKSLFNNLNDDDLYQGAKYVKETICESDFYMMTFEEIYHLSDEEREKYYKDNEESLKEKFDILFQQRGYDPLPRESCSLIKSRQ